MSRTAAQASQPTEPAATQAKKSCRRARLKRRWPILRIYVVSQFNKLLVSCKSRSEYVGVGDVQEQRHSMMVSAANLHALAPE